MSSKLKHLIFELLNQRGPLSPTQVRKALYDPQLFKDERTADVIIARSLKQWSQEGLLIRDEKAGKKAILYSLTDKGKKELVRLKQEERISRTKFGYVVDGLSLNTELDESVLGELLSKSTPTIDEFLEKKRNENIISRLKSRIKGESSYNDVLMWKKKALIHIENQMREDMNYLAKAIEITILSDKELNLENEFDEMIQRSEYEFFLGRLRDETIKALYRIYGIERQRASEDGRDFSPKDFIFNIIISIDPQKLEDFSIREQERIDEGYENWKHNEENVVEWLKKKKQEKDNK